MLECLPRYEQGGIYFHGTEPTSVLCGHGPRWARQIWPRFPRSLPINAMTLSGVPRKSRSTLRASGASAGGSHQQRLPCPTVRSGELVDETPANKEALLTDARAYSLQKESLDTMRVDHVFTG